MNEPPSPYSVKHLLKKWTVVRSKDGMSVQYVCWRESMEQALSERDNLNAAYMQGWRDRDEANDDE
jgi:hypothetical protein